MRPLVCFIVLGLFTSTILAQTPIQTARENLDKAKLQYQETSERAKSDLEAAGERVVNKLRASNKSNVADQLARIDKIETQLREFSESRKLPTDAALSGDVDRYRETISKARQKCEKAFDALAQRYVAAKDDSNAKMVLEEKSRYFQRGFLTGTFVIATNPPLGHATLELTAEGKFKQIQDEKWIFTGTWNQSGEKEILLNYVNANYGIVTLKILDDDHLSGPNVHPDGKTWNWRVIRQSAATFPTGDFECTTVPDEGLWIFSLNKDGTCTNTSPDGRHVDRGNWQQYGDEIRFEFCLQGYYENVGSSGTLKITDKDHLDGFNQITNSNRKWTWAAVRKKSDKGGK